MPETRTFNEWIGLFCEETREFKKTMYKLRFHEFVLAPDKFSIYLKCTVCHRLSDECLCIKNKEHLR